MYKVNYLVSIFSFLHSSVTLFHSFFHFHSLQTKYFSYLRSLYFYAHLSPLSHTLFSSSSSLLPPTVAGRDLFAEILKELLPFFRHHRCLAIIQCIERGHPLITPAAVPNTPQPTWPTIHPQFPMQPIPFRNS